MPRRSCLPAPLSSNGDGLRDRKDKTSADAAEVHALPATHSADLPVRPFGAEPAAPALAAGAPPDAPTATPARALLAFFGILLLCSAVPVAAGKCIDKTRHHQVTCPMKARQLAAVAAPAKKVVSPPAAVVLKSSGGGSAHWMPIASDLMP